MSSDTRHVILEQSCQLFASKGYEGTSMDDVARAVGVRKASLYYHFDSKYEIFFTLLREILEYFQKAYARDPGSDPEKTLTEILERTIQFGFERGGFLEEAKMPKFETNNRQACEMSLLTQKLEASVASFLKKARVKDPKLSAHMLADATQGYMTRKMAGTEKSSPKKFSQFLSARIVKG